MALVSCVIHVHTNPSVVVTVAPLVPGLSESAETSSPLCFVVSPEEAMGNSELSAAVADDEEASCKKNIDQVVFLAYHTLAQLSVIKLS